MRNLLRAALLVLLPSCAASAPQARKGPHLEKECLFLEGAGVRAVVMPETAGRIVWYGIGEENILWNNPDKATGKPRPGGGYGLCVGPEPRTIPESPVIWRSAHRGEADGGAIRVASEACPTQGVRLVKTVRMDGATGALDLDQRMENTSKKDQSWCFWDRTLCRAGGYAIIPLNPKSRFPAKWVRGQRSKTIPWEYNGKDPVSDKVRILDGVLVAHATGPEQKIGADSDAGWIAYALGTLLFVKHYPYDPKGNYTDGGLSVAHYFNNDIAELEPISPERAFGPGASIHFPQRWTILRLDREVKSFEDARALVSRIRSVQQF